MPIDWTPEYDAKLRSLREQGYSFGEIAEALSAWFLTEFTKDSVQKRYQRMQPVVSLRDSPLTEYMPYWSEWFFDDGEPRTEPPKLSLHDYVQDLNQLDRKVEVLHVSDLHVPLHDDELLDRVLRRNESADLVVVGGDALEIYAYSRFPKRRNLPIEREIDSWLRIESFLSRFPMVVVIDSNHLERIRLSLGGIPMGLQFLVESNLMRHLARPFNNIHVVDQWWWQLNDAVFAHGDYSGGKAPKSAAKVLQKLDNLRLTHQVQMNDIRVLVQAHTHQVGSGVETGRKIIESGCLAKLPLEYVLDQRSIGFTNPQQNGYAIVTQYKGRSILNECREYFLPYHYTGESTLCPN